MRFGFGILSVLIAMAIMLWLMVGTGYLKTVSTANKQAKQQINVISGKSSDGTILATDSVLFKVDTKGKPKLIVTKIFLTGPMDERYGLRKDDRILEIGAIDTAMSVTSHDDATAFLHDAYARGWPLTVMRDGKKITLPTQEHVAEWAAKRKADAIAATSQPAVPVTAPPTYEPGSLEKALDGIMGGNK